jgi:outer membrane protein TolC
LTACGLAGRLAAQNRAGGQSGPVMQEQAEPWYDRAIRPYRPQYVPPSDLHDSSRIDSLIRAGQLYLSLQDAIALAIENNLDIELERYGPRFAQSDFLRSQAGALLRGVPLTLRQLPQGSGGPGAPLLTTVGGSSPATNLPSNSGDLAPITELTTDLSIQGSFPLSSGSPIPAYDPILTGTLNGQHVATPQASTLSYGTNTLTSTGFNGNFGFQQAFASGASINAGYDNSYLNTNATRLNYNPYTTASLGVTVTQPLLQGFGFALNRRYITIAKNDERITDLVFRQQLIETVADVIRLYWDEVSLVEDVKVKRQELATAQKLFEDNKSQVEIGTLAPLELRRAQAEVARSHQDLTNAESLVLQQELLLKNVLTRNAAANPLIRAAHIVPLDHIEIPKEEQPQPIQDLLSEAFQNRPDLAQAHIQIENSQISLKGSKNELLPQLNLVGIVQNNALTGETLTTPTGGFVPTPNPDFLGGYGNGLAQLFLRNTPNYGIGLQLVIPLKNRAAQADVVRDQLQLRQTEVRMRQLENQVRLEVENALVAMQQARISYQAAAETRQLQEEALAAEQERYSVGASTTFFVIQYERDLAQARSTEVVSLDVYAKARAALDRALGETLTKNNVDIDEAYRGRVARPPSQLPVLDQK